MRCFAERVLIGFRKDATYEILEIFFIQNMRWQMRDTVPDRQQRYTCM